MCILPRCRLIVFEAAERNRCHDRQSDKAMLFFSFVTHDQTPVFWQRYKTAALRLRSANKIPKKFNNSSFLCVLRKMTKE